MIESQDLELHLQRPLSSVRLHSQVLVYGHVLGAQHSTHYREHGKKLKGNITEGSEWRCWSGKLGMVLFPVFQIFNTFKLLLNGKIRFLPLFRAAAPSFMAAVMV